MVQLFFMGESGYLAASLTLFPGPLPPRLSGRSLARMHGEAVMRQAWQSTEGARCRRC